MTVLRMLRCMANGSNKTVYCVEGVSLVRGLIILIGLGMCEILVGKAEISKKGIIWIRCPSELTDTERV